MSIIRKLKFGKYKNVIGYYDYGTKIPFNINILSTVTKQNIKDLLCVGWNFTDMVICKVEQFTWNNQIRSAKSYFIIGTNNIKEPIIYARIETESSAAGQTKIIYENRRVQASIVLSNVRQYIKLQNVITTQDNDKASQLICDII